MKPKKPFLSVIVPVFNEEKRIKNLQEIVNYLRKQKFSWELIVVNDGSTDKTGKILELLKKQLKFKLMSYSPNAGKGLAVKTGMLESTGKYRLFLDVDLSTPITELGKFLPHLKHYDIVIGSRKLKSSQLVTRQSFVREHLGKVFTLLSQHILKMNNSDFTCGFKVFSEQSAVDVFSRQRINKWGFDPEILYIGKIKKYSIKEVAVHWENDPRTKVKFPDDIINSLTELIRIRINYLKGIYR